MTSDKETHDNVRYIHREMTLYMQTDTQRDMTSNIEILDLNH